MHLKVLKQHIHCSTLENEKFLIFSFVSFLPLGSAACGGSAGESQLSGTKCQIKELIKLLVMLKPKLAPSFKKDIKRLKKKKIDVQPLKDVIMLVLKNSKSSTKELKRRHNMHKLKGNWEGSFTPKSEGIIPSQPQPCTSCLQRQCRILRWG